MIQYVTIQLDRPRKLRIGMGAMVAYEQEFGEKLADIDEESVTSLARLLWVALRKDDPALTLDSMIDIVDENAPSLEYVSTKLRDAIHLASQTGAKLDPNA